MRDYEARNMPRSSSAARESRFTAVVVVRDDGVGRADEADAAARSGRLVLAEFSFVLMVWWSGRGSTRRQTQPNKEDTTAASNLDKQLAA